MGDPGGNRKPVRGIDGDVPTRKLAWSGWLPLMRCFDTDAIPAVPGVNRIRARDERILAYVGQTGRSLRERLRSLRGVYAPEMPYRDPHTAAGALGVGSTDWR
jgi:hypothetical protein